MARLLPLVLLVALFKLDPAIAAKLKGILK